MVESTRGSAGGAAVGTLVAAVAAAVWLAGTSVQGARELSSAPLRAEYLDDVVLVAVCAVGTLVAGWYALSAALLLSARALEGRGRGRSAVGSHLLATVARAGAPGLRRLAAGSLLAGLTLTGGTTAFASPTAASDDLGWSASVSVPSPGPAQTPAQTPAQIPAQTASATPHRSAAPAAQSPAAPYVVQPGDCLWDIAERHLPGTPSNLTIAHEWQRWYAANAAVIGGDPDLIRPGTVLVPPAAQR